MSKSRSSSRGVLTDSEISTMDTASLVKILSEIQQASQQLYRIASRLFDTATTQHANYSLSIASKLFEDAHRNANLAQQQLTLLDKILAELQNRQDSASIALATEIRREVFETAIVTNNIAKDMTQQAELEQRNIQTEKWNKLLGQKETQLAQAIALAKQAEILITTNMLRADALIQEAKKVRDAAIRDIQSYCKEVVDIQEQLTQTTPIPGLEQTTAAILQIITARHQPIQARLDSMVQSAKQSIDAVSELLQRKQAQIDALATEPWPAADEAATGASSASGPSTPSLQDAQQFMTFSPQRTRQQTRRNPGDETELSVLTPQDHRP